MKKMKKRTIIFLVVLFVFVVTVGVLVYTNRNTLTAMYYTFTNQNDKLEQKKLNTDERAMDVIREFGIESVRPLTEDETKKLSNGEITEQQAVDMVLGRNNETDEPEKESEQPGTVEGNSAGNTGTKNNNPSVSNTSDEYKAKNEEIAELIGKMYVLKAQFTSDLSDIEDWVKDEYWKYTKQYGEGNVPSSVKMKIGQTAYANALTLEKDCDAQVNVIFNRITTLLKETKQSTVIVDEMKAAYDNEKMVAKSYYMSQF